MCPTAECVFGLQEESINISNPQGKPLIKKTVLGTTERGRDRWTEKERREEGVRFMKKKHILSTRENTFYECERPCGEV